MRAYKFRGYRKDGKGWVYGDLCSKDSEFGVSIVEGSIRKYSVYPESVGQYIGVKTPNSHDPAWDLDPANKLIELYEGDIVEAWSEGTLAKFTIKWRQESSPGFILYPSWQDRQMWHIHGSKLNRSSEMVDRVVLRGNEFEEKFGHILSQ